MPMTPISVSASLTSSSLNGLMTASIFFMGSDLLQDRDRERRHVGADPLEVRQDVEMDLGRLDGLGQARAEPSDVQLAQVALALADERTLVEHLLRHGPLPPAEAPAAAPQALP